MSSPDTRTGTDAEALKTAILETLYYTQAKFAEVATRNDFYMALAYVVRDRMLRRWVTSAQTYYRQAARTVIYLSTEYTLGPHLGNNLVNLGLYDAAKEAVKSLGLTLDDLLAQEEEPGLGTGGVGRLAACFQDSMATLCIPAIGYGIRYEFGVFDQTIRDGWQTELTDKWLRYGNPWEIARPEITFRVGFGGRTRVRTINGRQKVEWVPGEVVMGMAYDTPILSYKGGNANLLRLWQAQAVESFDFQAFNVGDYERAVTEKMQSENITKVLYPSDEPSRGKDLRLRQQYFFATCALRDMIRIYGQRAADLMRLHEKYAIQLNDTHPAIAIAELMRLLVDEYDMDWDPAWEVTRNTFSYTNHTVVATALETWPVDIFHKLLPRHLEIIFEINRRWLDRVRAAYPHDFGKTQRMSLISERGDKAVRMAHLAAVGSHTVNGVSAQHTRHLTEDVFGDFAAFEPGKFRSITNGVAPRRFLMLSNRPLAALITRTIGDSWPSDLDRLKGLEAHAGDSAFRDEWKAVKREAKVRLASLLLDKAGVTADPDALFDVQAKRITEYKRPHLNVLQVIARYLRIKDNPNADVVPRLVLFAGKAAPGYYLSKLIIKLIHGVAEVVNADADVRGRLRVAFLPNFNVQTSQWIYPAADLSEQIATAGKEASGTGNMKFALNGALTIGTLDGATVEIRDRVGADNFFLFGLTAEEAAARLASGYRPAAEAEANTDLRRTFAAISSGRFSRGNGDLFRPLIDSMMKADPYLVIADYPGYDACRERAAQEYAAPAAWVSKSIFNVARMGWFSSDRCIREYSESVWRVKPVKVAE